jgi:CheY-like chemotaxis protein
MSVSEARSGNGGVRETASLPVHLVLLVDPHEDTRNLYSCYLKLEGCDVDVAEDGREALVKALTRPYDAIVTETRLPGIDGYQLCRLLRSDAATLKTPILFVTADARMSEPQARSVGANAFLVKPCLPEMILGELRRIAVNGDGAENSQPDGPIRAEVVAPRPRRAILSRVHQRGSTTTPPNPPPTLHCPSCDKILSYEHSYVGGVSVRHAEQWDYFECPAGCGRFEYRQRTRNIRLVSNDVSAT